MPNDFYAEISADYDRIIRWQHRLKHEQPLWKQLWDTYQTRTVLDAACGSGHHLVLFAQQHLSVTGTDASPSMLALARKTCARLSPSPVIETATWSELADSQLGQFDAVLCVGNSLPYVTDQDELKKSIAGLWSRVAQGGILIIQMKNFVKLRRDRTRFLPLSWGESEASETVCLRLYDYHDAGVTFNVILLDHANSEWRMRHHASELACYTESDLTSQLKDYTPYIRRYGGLGMQPFDPDASPDLVIIAQRN